MASLFFHLRKQLSAAMPDTFGGGTRPLHPADTFNNTGVVNVVSGDFNALADQLQAAVGQSYVVQRNEAGKTLTIKRVTDV